MFRLASRLSLPSASKNVVSRSISTDVYPSRGNDVTISDRKHPVVWGQEPKGPLNKEQMKKFDQNGYLLLPNVFSPTEIDNMLTRAMELKEKGERELDNELFIREPASQQVRSAFKIHEWDSLFRKVARFPSLVSIASQILEDDVYLHQSRINYKPAFFGKEFYWHSDFETWHQEDGMPAPRAVSCVVLLSENTLHNGPLLLIPGSHKKFISCRGETPEDHYKHSLREQQYGVPDTSVITDMAKKYGIDAPIGPLGSVLFFDCNTLHGSNSNISPQPRTNLFMVYNSVQNQLVDPFCGRKPRPHFIAEREVHTLD